MLSRCYVGTAHSSQENDPVLILLMFGPFIVDSLGLVHFRKPAMTDDVTPFVFGKG